MERTLLELAERGAQGIVENYEILGIRRGAVLVTTVLSAGAWGLAGMLISQIMLSSGILIISPGL